MDERRLNFSEIIEILKLNKKLIYRNSLIFFFLSIVISCSIPDRYTSHAVLASSEVEGSNLSKSSLPTSGLGIISMNSISPRMQQALEIMESWEFIENFISENKLEVYIYAVEGWDEDTHQLEINSDLYHLGESKWIIESDESPTGYRPPSSYDLYEKFLSMINIDFDGTKGLVKISLEYYSPEMAKNFLISYINSINQHMRKKKLDQVETNIEYLQEQIEKTNIAVMKEYFYSTIQEQLRQKMLAEASSEFALTLVSKPMKAEYPSSPSRLIIVLFWTILSFILTILWILIKEFREQD